MPKYAELSRVLYRSILRWARNEAGDIPFTLRGKDVAEVQPHLNSLVGLDLEDGKAVLNLARTGFRHNQHLEDPEEASEALELGLKGLRLLNCVYSAQLRDLKALRLEHLDRHNVEYSIGQVFLHGKHGYRGVIYGWDAKCGRDPEWAANLGVCHDQPFYKVLPDEDDCQKHFGSTRITKYVAQENVIPITVPRRVTHRVLGHYFEGYSPSRMQYIPNRQLQYEYPDAYDAPDTVSCKEDTNILRIRQDVDPQHVLYPEHKRSIGESKQSAASYEPD